MAKQMVKTVVAWDSSPDPCDGYAVKVVINGKEQSHELPTHQLYIQVESEVRGDLPQDRDNVLVMVAPFRMDGNKKIWGMARPINFLTQAKQGPGPVPKIYVASVNASLPVLDLPPEQPHALFNLMIIGHGNVLDGTVVQIKGFDPEGKFVTADVPRGSLTEAGLTSAPDAPTWGLVFSLDDMGVQYTVIPPNTDQTLTLEQYLHNVTKLPTVPALA